MVKINAKKDQKITMHVRAQTHTHNHYWLNLS